MLHDPGFKAAVLDRRTSKRGVAGGGAQAGPEAAGAEDARRRGGQVRVQAAIQVPARPTGQQQRGPGVALVVMSGLSRMVQLLKAMRLLDCLAFCLSQ